METFFENFIETYLSLTNFDEETLDQEKFINILKKFEDDNKEILKTISSYEFIDEKNNMDFEFESPFCHIDFLFRYFLDSNIDKSIMLNYIINRIINFDLSDYLYNELDINNTMLNDMNECKTISVFLKHLVLYGGKLSSKNTKLIKDYSTNQITPKLLNNILEK